MKKYILFFLFMPMVVFGQGLAGPQIPAASVDSLTLEQCVQIALKYNPQIRLAEGGLEASKSGLKLSVSGYMPQITGTASGTRNGGTFVLGPIARSGYFDNFSAGFTAQQTIFDFGKTISKVAASSDLVDVSHENLRSTTQDVVLNTHISYFNYLAAVRVLEVDSETVSEALDHLRQAQGFYKAGTVPQYDVVNAEVEVANAKVSLIEARNNLKIARVQLENVLGVNLPVHFKLDDNLGVSYVSVDMTTAIETALKNRPELLASEAQVQASKSLLTEAWTQDLPDISATAGYKWNGADPQPLYPSWNVGLTLSVPIFDGFALDAGIDQAKANLKSAEASNDIVMQTLYLDVQQQEYALQEAREKIQAAKKLVEQATEALRLAVGQYNSGTGSAIEVTDAQVTLANARISYIQSLYDYNVSYATLQRAMGIIK
ncbi:MAG: TolC family protein [Bacteroidetes bacterium]|nr:TolC family protein [Bacteroidota bacterium]